MIDLTGDGAGGVIRRRIPRKRRGPAAADTIDAAAVVVDILEAAREKGRAPAPARTKNLDPDGYFVEGAIKYPWGAKRGGKLEWEKHLAPADTPEDKALYRHRIRGKRWPKSETHDRVPDWLAPRPEVSANAKLVYARMRRLATGDGGGPPVAYPSIKRLQIDVGLNYKQVRNALAELRRHRLIAAVHRTEDGVTAYRFVDHPWRRTFMGSIEPEERRERFERSIRSIMNDPTIPDFPESLNYY